MAKQTVTVRVVRALVSGFLGLAGGVFYLGATAPVQYHNAGTTFLTAALATISFLSIVAAWVNATDTYVY